MTTKTKKKTPTKRPRFKPAGQVIAEVRADAGLTQVQLAKLCRIGQNRESAIEKSPNLTWVTMCTMLDACRSKTSSGGYVLPWERRKPRGSSVKSKAKNVAKAKAKANGSAEKT